MIQAPFHTMVWLPPLADIDLLHSIRDGMNTGPQGAHIAVFVVGALILCGLLILFYRYWSPETRSATRPGADYLKIACELLELSDQEQRDVRRIARLAGLSQPVALLLSPTNLAWATDRALARTSEPDLRRRMDRLSRKLFESRLPALAPAEPHR